MSSASSVSVQKSLANSRSKSCDTVCTSNSSCILQKRKAPNPLSRSNLTKSTNNIVKQRLYSAKLLKFRSIQSQLNDANYHLSELARENQTLKSLQKRQDKALSKYENTNAELPRLLHSHEEEIRVLTVKNREFRKTVRELNDLLKSKDDELTTVREQIKHLEKLTKDKRLGEREKLADQVEELRFKLSKSEDQISVLNRKLMLESKSAKHKLNLEISKHKQCQRELNQALEEVGRLTNLVQQKSSEIISPRKNRVPRLPNRPSLSLLNLTGSQLPKPESTGSESTRTDSIKLEPIKPPPEDKTKSNGILKSPSENIKNRLSAGSTSFKPQPELETRASFSNSDITTPESHPPSTSSSLSSASRPNSAQKLAKLSNTLEAAIEKASENNESDFDTKLGGYCAQVIETVKNCTDVINGHKENLRTSREQSQSLMDMFEETKSLERKLKDKLKLEEDKEATNEDIVDQILKDEYKFQVDNKNEAKKQEPLVNIAEKKKLLAALKAIDNGESFESENNDTQNAYAKELFGHVLQN